MLPSPVSSRRRPFRKPSYSNLGQDTWSYKIKQLSQRSRVTNLAVLILTSALLLSVFLNVKHWLQDVTPSVSLLKSIEETISRPNEIKKLEHLIIVPGHGIWTGNEQEEIQEESTWELEHYQSGGGAQTRIGAFVSHIRGGVHLADSDPKSLLVFSGGATRKDTPTSEAASYFSLALTLQILDTSPPRQGGLPTYERTTIEDYALDSFQNLLFSVARFRAFTGHYPERITVVGYGLKEARFSELHRAALRWPMDKDKWHYVGIDMDDATALKEAVKGERINGYEPYTRDLYGCHGTLLEKRRLRNVHRRTHPYHISAPEIAPLLEWCPDTEPPSSRARPSSNRPTDPAIGTFTSVYNGLLPWDED